MDLTKLNDEQLKAVKYNDGPLLIIAGAGSGKTRVLTVKIAYLIEKLHISPYNILAITFTNKAANEMKERVHNLIGNDAEFIQISTFHSFGVRILREKDNAKLLGYDKHFSIVDSEDTLVVIKKILKELNLDPKYYNPRSLRNKISSLKNDMLMPDDYEKYTASDYEKACLNVYRKYQKKLKEGNLVDFDDLLLLPIKLFKENKKVLEYYQERFKYILIDEYQDTNEAQYKFSKMLASKYRNITVVGDDSQCIYGFRGSNYKNILNFEKDYKDAKTILLEENYRSTTNILDAANDVIKHNKNKKEKSLWTKNEQGNKIKYYRAYNEKEEARYVVRKIKELVSSGVNYEDIAVLYRTNAQSRVLEEEILKDNLPYKVVGSFYFYSRKEIKDLIAYLKIIYNEKDNVSLLRIINYPKRKIGSKTIEKLTERAEKEGISLYEAIDSGKELKFKKVIEDLKKVKDNVTLTELIDKVLDASGIRKELESEKTLEAEIRLENLEEFKSITRGFEEKEGLISLEDFLFEISLVSDKEEYSNDNNRINLMTIHSVKGLEFDYVFVVGVEEGLFPHINSLMDEKDLEEERRLCYVAITRAKKDLYLINAKRRVLFGKDEINPPSRFIGEIREELLDANAEIEKKEEKIEEEEIFRDEEIDYTVGDYVYHETFGTGKVVEVTETLVSVAFKHPYGVKKLMKNHKKLSKI